VTLQVTGADGGVREPGEVGAVRVRGTGMVAGYLDDAVATGLMFREGWFCPGDLAVRDAAGGLRLVGRRVDVLNLGGAKVPSVDLESRIAACHGVRDVAVLQRNDDTHSPPLTVCVVAAREVLAPLEKTVRALIDFPFTLRQVARIPRTNEGKIRRLELQEALFGQAGAREMKQAVLLD
jgi:acyl-coenzyme A synthetase/AMP-(fatty) acid ligase